MRAKYLLYALVVIAAIAFGWLAKQSYSVYKLTRGVGDTWFHTADGRRWFRLDEQRHDVPISAIAPFLWSNLDEAKRRSHVVLARMREEGFITAAEEQQAKQATIRVQPYRSDSDSRHGYAKAYLRQRFRDEFGGDHPPDWRVDTTFIAHLQDAAERAIEDGLRKAGKPTLQGALVAINPETGDILALVGGRDYARSAFNRASRSRRQPGSAFKPFVFAAALERGMSPVTVLKGLSHIAPQGPDEWTLRNVRDDAADEMTLRAALLESNNRAATLLQQEVGTRNVIRLASDTGLEDMPDVPSLALGAGLVTPLAITNAYAVFPNGGLVVRPRDIIRVRDADGGTAFRQPVVSDRVIKPEVAYQMVSMLGDVVDRGTGSAVRGLAIKFPVGGKTGTTNEFKDAWFVGFSSSIVAGVWVGYDQPHTIAPDAYGARYALPIWADFMARAARVRVPAEFERPAGLAEETLCAISYRKPVDGCPIYIEYLKEGDDVPSRLCTLHRGSIRQRLTRTFQGWMAEAGRRVRATVTW